MKSRLVWGVPQRTSMLASLLSISCTNLGAPPSQRWVAESLQIGPQWVELVVDPTLPVRRREHELVLHHSRGLTFTRSGGSAPGAVFSPSLNVGVVVEAELLDGEGHVSALAPGGLSPGRLGLRPVALPAPTFAAGRVRLRSSVPLDLDRVEWRELGRPAGAAKPTAARASNPGGR